MMHGPDGTDYPNKIVYAEVTPPDRLIYTHGTWEDDDVNGQFNVTVTFSETIDGTELTMRSIFPSAEARDIVVREYGAIEGGKQTLARLAQYIKHRQN